MKHENTGHCLKCRKIIDRFPGLYTPLLEWFEFFQKRHPEAHVSCAGRGEADQNHVFEQGLSRAQWRESAHNWNAALDFFVVIPGKADIYDKHWFELVLGKNIPQWLTWYGAPGSKFYELPHVEVKNWKGLRDNGELKLVSPFVNTYDHGNGD